MPATRQRQRWFVVTLLLTVVPIVAAVALAPKSGSGSGAALGWLLFVGSSVHVASSGWFYSVPEVRAHMHTHRARYYWAPLALVVGLAVAAAMVGERQLRWVLIAFFAWQFFHFQKQNLGIAAIAARARGLPGLSTWERRSLVIAGIGGIAALLGHPDLLQIAHLGRTGWVFAAGAVVLLVGVATGAISLIARRERTPDFVAMYLSGLLFFLPVLVFSSPYAAVAGLTIAHGLQYLILVTLVAAAPDQARPASVSLLILVNVALVLGIALNRAAHLHTSDTAGRAVFGLYLGLVCAHFVIDAGLWRLREEFPRQFLTERLPYLLASADV